MIYAATINLAAAATAYQLFERMQSAGVLGLGQLADLRVHVLKMNLALAAAEGTTVRLTTAGDAAGAVDLAGPSPNAGYEFGNEAVGGTGAAATPATQRDFELKVDGNTISLKEIYLATSGTNVEVQIWAMSI